MIAPWTDRFFWPALIGAWLAAITIAAALALPKNLEPILQPIIVVLAGLAAFMFMVMLLDRQARHAINTFNATTAKQLAKRSFFAHLFAPEWGDRRLLFVNRLVWLEVACAIFVDRQDLALLGFVSFMLSTMMMMLSWKAKVS